MTEMNKQKGMPTSYASESTQDQPVWLRQLEDLFKVFSMISEGTYIYLCDLEHDYSIWSRKAVDTFGLPGTHMENAGEIWEAHIHPDDRSSYHRSIEMIFTGQMSSHDMQYRAREKSGQYDMCTCRGLVMLDDEGKPRYFGGSIRNHTLEDSVDPLTGLMNRAGFFAALKNLISNHREANLVMFGPSEFSQVNSLYGYEFGNRVIEQIARHFSEELANCGDFFRLDGTQSILISHDVSSDILKAKYQRLREWTFNELAVDGKQIPLRLNGAMMHLDQFEVDDNTVFVCLNTAFQKSKREVAGDLIDFNNQREDGSRDDLHIINTIRTSQTRGFQGFELYYQPIVDAETERLRGAEALLRWKNDDFGFVPPDKFLPVLENDAQFYSLGLWIIKRALEDGLPMVKVYPDFVLHVNIAYTQIQQANFVQDVIRLLKETGYPAKNFCLELTERCRLVDKKLLRNVIVRLKAHGIRFALDDFGTGYASTDVLKEVFVDVIKIDRSFILNIETDRREQRLLHNLTELAKIYRAEVCVEGIENPGMRECVLHSSVDTLQGYYYSKPIPAEDFCQKFKIELIEKAV